MSMSLSNIDDVSRSPSFPSTPLQPSASDKHGDPESGPCDVGQIGLEAGNGSKNPRTEQKQTQGQRGLRLGRDEPVGDEKGSEMDSAIINTSD